MRNIFSPLIVMASMFLFQACSEKEPAREDLTPQKKNAPALYFQINNVFSGNALEWSTMKYVNKAGNLLSVSKIAYLLSNFRLIKEDDTEVELPNAYAYLNAQQGRDTFSLQAPAGIYKGMKFMLGLDSTINHGNPNQWKFGHPLDPITNGLFWGWAGGYVFIALEGKVMISGKEEAYVYHLSRDNTEGVWYQLDFPSTEAKEGTKPKIHLELHANEFFQNPEDFNLETESRFLHSSSPAGDKLVGNMSDLFSVKNP